MVDACVSTWAVIRWRYRRLEPRCDSRDYRTPEEFRVALGYGDRESNVRFPHLHRPDYDGCEIISKQNLNRESPVING
jgi:hypothetical protein